MMRVICATCGGDCVKYAIAGRPFGGWTCAHCDAQRASEQHATQRATRNATRSAKEKKS
jgi:endogenous inhibitor of DNA gyrase (YacG/DUF329 family)